MLTHIFGIEGYSSGLYKLNHRVRCGPRTASCTSLFYIKETTEYLSSVSRHSFGRMRGDQVLGNLQVRVKVD
jgi:hypothetical protein